MEEIPAYKYLTTADPPAIKVGKYDKEKNVESWVNHNCVPLENNQVGVSYLLELKQEGELIVQMFAESYIQREDEGEVEKRMMVATLRALIEGLNMYCEDWMKANHDYTFKDHLNTPTLASVEEIVTALLANRN